MQRNELIRCGENIFRVLETKEDKALVINCVQKSMPKWANCSDFTGYEPCTEESLHQMTNRILPDMDALPSTDRRIAHERYTLIAGILPFIGDDKRRCEVIARIAEDRNVSKQTIRNYLRLYLVYQSIAALAPCHTPESAVFFEHAMQLARRSLGLQYNRLEYVVAYAVHSVGRSSQFVEMAARQGKMIVRIP